MELGFFDWMRHSISCDDPHTGMSRDWKRQHTALISYECAYTDSIKLERNRCEL